MLPGAVLSMGLLATAISDELVRLNGAERHQRIEDTLIEAVQVAVNTRLEVNIALLAAVKGLFEATPAVSRQQFARFLAAAAAAGTLRCIQGVGFSRAILPGELSASERAIQAEGFRGYRVHPPGDRQLYSAPGEHPV